MRSYPPILDQCHQWGLETFVEEESSPSSLIKMIKMNFCILTGVKDKLFHFLWPSPFISVQVFLGIKSLERSML
jgi:hypothetical protein